MAKQRKKTTVEPTASETAEPQFFEIVNWKKAQPRMKGGANDWLKLYTSLLEHDGFCAMDDSARMLIVALWLYAARSGLHILPADPAWLARKIPMLRAEPDLGPLLEAADCYGNPTPFIRYCKPPKARKGRKPAKAAKPRSAGGTGGKSGKSGKGGKVSDKAGKSKSKKKQGEENRAEESRREEREQRKPLRVSREESRERKERVVTTAAQTEETEQTAAEESENPENPTDSEAGSAKSHIMPKPAPSAFSSGKPQKIGSIIAGRFPEHWQDPDAEAFGWEIVEALGYSTDRKNLHSRSEWGSFAKWWSKVKNSVSPIILDDIRQIAIAKAKFINSPKCKSAKNKSAVWFHIMAGEMNHRGIRLPDTRAGPYAVG